MGVMNNYRTSNLARQRKLNQLIIKRAMTSYDDDDDDCPSRSVEEIDDELISLDAAIWMQNTKKRKQRPNYEQYQ